MSFHALGDEGILCGTDFVEYEPFPDAPEQVPVEEESGFAGLWGNILAGLAVVAAVSLAAAYLASLVFTAGASAAIAPMVVGGTGCGSRRCCRSWNSGKGCRKRNQQRSSQLYHEWIDRDLDRGACWI